jgi:hypothetical protein
MRLKVLRSNVSLVHVVFLNALTVVVVAMVALAAGVGAATPDAFRPAGSYRMVTAYSADSVDVHQSGVALLLGTFTVPSGKRADIQATFSTNVVSRDLGPAVGLCLAEMLIDSGTSLKPGSVVLLDKGVDNGSGYYGEQRTFLAFKSNIGPGTHNVLVVGGAGGNGCWYGPSTLFIDANLH